MEHVSQTREAKESLCSLLYMLGPNKSFEKPFQVFTFKLPLLLFFLSIATKQNYMQSYIIL